MIKVSGKVKIDTQATFWSEQLFLLLYHVNTSRFFPEICNATLVVESFVESTVTLKFIFKLDLALWTSK